MFRGLNGINVDIKGRMAIPTRYRNRVQQETSTVILTIDTDDRCLLLYPLPEWEQIEKKLAGLPSFNPIVRRIQRLLIGHATDIDIDASGRILLPSLLREYAGIKKQAMLIGQGRKFELWDAKHWNESRARWLADESSLNDAALPEEIKSIAL